MAFNDLTAKDIKTALAGIPHPATPRGSIIYGGREIFPAYQAEASESYFTLAGATTTAVAPRVTGLESLSWHW
jgi:hypothetical protein